jgi:hypothetical protein
MRKDNTRIRPCKYAYLGGFILGLLVNLLGGASAYAQDLNDLVARIYYAEGTEFVLTAGNQRNIYPVGSLGAEGFNLNNADLIQTGAGTLLEIQLIPGGTVIKVAENTSLIYNGSDEGGRYVSLGLIYGRVRVINDAGEGRKNLMIRAGNTAVNLEKGDWGLDFLVLRGTASLGSGSGDSPAAINRPVLRIHGFSGSAALLPLGPEGALGTSEFSSVQVHAGESLSFEAAGTLSFLERKPLEQDILNYWKVHSFAGSAPLTIPGTAQLPEDTSLRGGELNVDEERFNYSPPDYTPFVKAVQGKNGAIAAGLLFTAAGAALGGYAFWSPDISGPYARNLQLASFASLGQGLITLLAALFSNPPLP